MTILNARAWQEQFSPSEVKNRHAAANAVESALHKGAKPFDIVNALRRFFEAQLDMDETIDWEDEHDGPEGAAFALRGGHRERSKSLLALVAHLCSAPPDMRASIALASIGEREGSGDEREWYDLMAGELLITIARLAQDEDSPHDILVKLGRQLAWDVQARFGARGARGFLAAIKASSKPGQ